jgi:hypothetical protein
MMRWSRLTSSVLICLLIGSPALAVEPRSEHTYTLSEGEPRPRASLADAAFLVGSWEGTAFGQTFEEVWNPPSAGSMVGLFKLMDGDQVVLYEIMLLKVEEGSLSLKVKHFSPDFTAWEKKDEYVNFRLVDFKENALHFQGISFYRRDDKHMDAWLLMREGEELKEEKLSYRRVDP